MPLGGGHGLLSKGVSGAIGLATEAYAHHKESKEPKQQAAIVSSAHRDSNLSPPTYEGGENDLSDAYSNESSDNEDDEDWIRDEMETQLEPNRADEDRNGNQALGDIIETFTNKYPPPSYATAVGRLPCTVITPQRRPETNRRGFVAAYAPVLTDYRIDERTFMDFHECFHKATNKQG